MSGRRRQITALHEARGKRTTRVSGHALWAEGGAFESRDDGTVDHAWGHVGFAICECDAHSGQLRSNNERKAWHRQHKLDVLAGGSS